MKCFVSCTYMPTFRFPKSGDFAYELNMKQRIMNFHDICNSPILIFIIFIFIFGFPKGGDLSTGFPQVKKCRMHVISNENIGKPMSVKLSLVFQYLYYRKRDTECSEYYLYLTLHFAKKS